MGRFGRGIGYFRSLGIDLLAVRELIPGGDKEGNGDRND